MEESYRLGYKKAAGALGFSLIYAPELVYDRTYPNPDFDYIFKLFEEGRALKDVETIRGLAFMYREGRSVPRDDKKMIELYEEAAALGDNQAQYLLGAFYSGQSILFYYLIQPDRVPFKDVDKEKGLNWLKKAANNGNLYAWEMLAKYYDREEHNPKLQEYYLREGAKHGNKNLLIELSSMYRNSKFFPIADLSDADRKRLDACVINLYRDLKPLDDKPITDFDKICPRKIQPIE
ncbi:tetratricopeptide repeat protein [Bartonella sp. HY038]|uniref:tetratricopeptide repeat protein n=1 Tax=Bartonella sp. HY038 TaxID=2759660 RepID=UPI0015F93C22|nr:tetratricopeptide repeat protein [Bartonella sp. HY038]